MLLPFFLHLCFKPSRKVVHLHSVTGEISSPAQWNAQKSEVTVRGAHRGRLHGNSEVCFLFFLMFYLNVKGFSSSRVRVCLLSAVTRIWKTDFSDSVMSVLSSCYEYNLVPGEWCNSAVVFQWGQQWKHLMSSACPQFRKLHLISQKLMFYTKSKNHVLLFFWFDMSISLQLFCPKSLPFFFSCD